MIESSANPPPTATPDEAPASSLGHRLMFLALTTLAFAVFAPTILLPIVRDYCELLAEEARLTDHITEVELELARREELTYAFENDAVINERLAVLDLRYKRPDEVIVPILSTSPMIHTERAPRNDPPLRSALCLPDDWPAWALDAEAWADEKGLISLFLDPSLRPVFLLLSGGLVIAAFVLFAPRPARKKTAALVSSQTA